MFGAGMHWGTSGGGHVITYEDLRPYPTATQMASTYDRAKETTDVLFSAPLMSSLIPMDESVLFGGAPSGGSGIQSGTGKRVPYDPGTIYTKAKATTDVLFSAPLMSSLIPMDESVLFGGAPGSGSGIQSGTGKRVPYDVGSIYNKSKATTDVDASAPLTLT